MENKINKVILKNKENEIEIRNNFIKYKDDEIKQILIDHGYIIYDDYLSSVEYVEYRDIEMNKFQEQNYFKKNNKKFQSEWNKLCKISLFKNL